MGPIVDDEFFSTVPGLDFDMFVLSTRIKTQLPRKYGQNTDQPVGEAMNK